MGLTIEHRDRLGRLLADRDLDGLLILAGSSRDPDLAPFVGSSHLGRSFLLLPREGAPLLAFLTDMEREEAAATDLALASPAALDIESLRPREGRPGAFWAGLVERAFALVGQSPGSWAVAGHLAAGTVVEACAQLAKHGWRWSEGGELLRLWRKYKPAARSVS